jgi:hypothetical protein
MTEAEFQASLQRPAPPQGLPPPLAALWHESRGDWDAAHRLVEDGATADACHVHAYLHRREGDTGNAGYWYRRAVRPVATGSLDAERQALVLRLLPGGTKG